MIVARRVCQIEPETTCIGADGGGGWHVLTVLPCATVDRQAAGAGDDTAEDSVMSRRDGKVSASI